MSIQNVLIKIVYFIKIVYMIWFKTISEIMILRILDFDLISKASYRQALYVGIVKLHILYILT